MRTLEDDAHRISEAARLLGVSAQYLRLLEGEGRIPTPRRVFGCRIFSAEEVGRLKAMGVGSGKRLRPFAEWARMPNPTVSYTPHGGISAKLEASILASIYALALQKSKDEKEAAGPGSLDDARKDEDAGTCSKCT